MRVFALSQRGHGGSSRPETAYRARDFAADVAAFMDVHGLPAAVITGHSMGSAVAARFALDHPGRTLGLVLAGAFRSLPDHPAPRELWDVVAKMDDPVDPEFVRGFQSGTLARPVPPAFLETVVQESLKLPTRVWKAVVACILQDDPSPDLGRIRAPTLLVWGDRDAIVPRDDQEAQLAAIAGSRLLVYEGAGHGLHWEEPGRFASDLVTFVQEVAGPGA